MTHLNLKGFLLLLILQVSYAFVHYQKPFLLTNARVGPILRNGNLDLQMRHFRSGRGGRGGIMTMSPSQASFPVPKLTVTNMLMFLNCLSFLFQQRNPRFTYKFLKNDGMISRGQTYRLVTSLFLHQGWIHLLTNLYSLNSFGPQADRILGPVRYLCTYLIAGILGNVCTYFWKTSPHALGASGSLFGLVGCFAIFYYRNKHIIGAEADAALSQIKQIVMLNLFVGGTQSSIDHAGHLGGFLSGAVLSYLFGPRLVIEKNSVRGRRILDKPIVPYRKIWRRFTSFLDGDQTNSPM